MTSLAEFEDGDIGDTALSFKGTKKKRKKHKKEKKRARRDTEAAAHTVSFVLKERAGGS